MRRRRYERSLGWAIAWAAMGWAMVTDNTAQATNTQQTNPDVKTPFIAPNRWIQKPPTVGAQFITPLAQATHRKQKVARGDPYARYRVLCRSVPKRIFALCHKYRLARRPHERFLLISGQPKRLHLCEGSHLLMNYAIGYGWRGMGKVREGDKKTPIGTYRIIWMAARHEPKRSAAKERQLRRYQIRDRAAYCWPDPKTGISHFRRDKGPADERLWMRPYGGLLATVMAIDYPNRTDRKAGRTGSCIEIHASFHRRGSAGCVILAPREMIQIYQCVHPGTRVEIRWRL